MKTEIEVLKIAMDYFGVSKKEINSKSRKREITDCRAIICWWYIKVMKLSQPQASLRFLRTSGFSRDNARKVENLRDYFNPIIEILTSTKKIINIYKK